MKRFTFVLTVLGMARSTYWLAGIAALGLMLGAATAMAKDRAFIFGCDEGQVVKWDDALKEWLCADDARDPETAIGLSASVGDARPAEANCPSGQLAVSGSCSFLNGPNDNDIVSCGPSADGGGWEGEANIVDPSNPLMVTAQCRSAEEFIPDTAGDCPCAYTVANLASDIASLGDLIDPIPFAGGPFCFVSGNGDTSMLLNIILPWVSGESLFWATFEAADGRTVCQRGNGSLIQRVPNLSAEELSTCADAIIRVAEIYGAVCPENPF